MTRKEFSDRIEVCIDNAMWASCAVESLLISDETVQREVGDTLLEDIIELRTGLESARTAIQLNDYGWADAILKNKLIPIMALFNNARKELFM